MPVLFLVISVVLIILLTVRWRLHPFIALLLAALLYGFMAGMPMTSIISSVNEGFGLTMGSIGLIIIFGVIIGTFLEYSGGAYALAEVVLRITGRKRIPAAMGLMGWIVSIPVFGDSGFMLLSPLNKSLTKKAGITIAGSTVALALGLTASHTMVPPTPGPIAAAGILGADLGLVLLVGIPVSLLALSVGLAYAVLFVNKIYIDPAPQMTEEDLAEKMKTAPSAFRSAWPVIIPIVLIVLRSLVKAVEGDEGNFLFRIVMFLGEPFIALCIGAFLSFTLPAKWDREMWSTSGLVGKSMRNAANILLITGAGGIFGKMLQNSGIAATLGETLSHFHLGIFLAFLLAAAIKTAQGSSTVALITTASILMPMMSTLGFTTELEKAIVVVVIGAGSAVVSHANDSFFWVVTQLSGFDVRQGYRLFTLGTFILGLSAVLFAFITQLLFT